MSDVTKTPTPQSISALLKRAGFEKSERAPGVRNWGRGTGTSSTGYKVSRDYGTGNVKVQFVTWSMGVSSSSDYVQGKLAQYAETIAAAGFEVLRPSPRWLIVTSPPSDPTPA